MHFLGYRDNVSHYYYKDSFIPIIDIFKIELAKFMFKYNNGFLPTSFNSYFERTNTIHNHFTRLSQHNFFLQRSNKTSGLNCLSNLGVKLWHGIPNGIKGKATLSSFIARYKEFLKNNYYKSIS